MPFIIGTAGHIDHGKTSLIKALTGQDTDRLKEEKERGISIELGFAHLDLPNGTRAGIIDVPGHERFIRTMLAGAHGMDLVLFTVAADDGVMPQTREHLDILHLLGVRDAIFVITKIDLVTTARVMDVEQDILTLVAGTSLAGSKVVPFSFATGEGSERLTLEITQALHRINKQPSSGYFRMPVDRVFILPGHGFVVTGTALEGEIKAGDRIHCLPGDQAFRVRSLQVHGEAVDVATAGQRVALNLTSQERPVVERGHVVCDERVTMTTDRFDASLELRPSASARIENHQRVRVHIGTAERFGKVVLLQAEDRPASAESRCCQIVLSDPILALRGDRFVIRDETAQRTLAGGVVLHPWPQPHRRREPDLDRRLNVLLEGEPVALAELFLDEQEEFASLMATLQQFLNQRTEEAMALLRGSAAIRIMTLDGEHYFTTTRKWSALREMLVSSLRAAHAADPLAPGSEMEEMRERLPGRIPPKLFRAWIEHLETEHVIARDGSCLRLPDHRVSLHDEARQVAERIIRLLAETPLAPPDLLQIARDTGIDRTRLTQVLRVLEGERSVVRVGPELYFLRDTLEGLKRLIRDEFSERPEVTPAAFRDRLAITRKHAIPLLEYLDREGVTVRLGNTRRVRASRSPVS